MSLQCTGTAIIRHAQTGVEYVIDADDLTWDESEDDDERAMGPEIHHTAVVEHPELGTLEWYVAEYPIGALNDQEANLGPHTLVRNFDFGMGSVEDDPRATVSEMVAWFFANYEDPAVRTPYESAEGGYQWIWGGPYEARDVLSDHFSDVPDELIERAVERVERDGITEWAPAEQPGDYDEDLDDEEPHLPVEQLLANIPSQRPGLMFAMMVGGRIGLVDPEPTNDPALSALKDVIEELRVVSRDLADQLKGTNAHQQLAVLVEQYRDAVVSDPLSVPRLYSLGVRLENARTFMSAAVAEGRVPELPSAPAESLQNLLNLHGVLIAGTASGKALIDHARDYALTAHEIAALRKATSQLHEAAVAQGDLLTPEAGEAIAAVVSETGVGPHPERSTEAAATASSNFLIVMGKWALMGVAGIAATQIIGTGIGASEAGILATESVTQFCNMASEFFLKHAHLIKDLAASLGPDGSWIRAVCDALNHLRKKH